MFDVMHDRPFQLLPDRLAGLPINETLHDGVPVWLEHPLRQWLNKALNLSGSSEGESLARRVVVRLRSTRKSADSYRSRLVRSSAEDLLTVVDATLQLHPGWEWRSWAETWDDQRTIENFGGLLAELNELLTDAGSLYRLDIDGHCLVRRVDATVEAAVGKATATTTTEAASHLRTAWVAAYGLHPDPDKAYDEAVLAIEELACSLVSPKNHRPTLGTVIGDLRNQLGQWELAIADSSGNPADISRFVEMLALLWEGQSRHAGSPNSRRQTNAEAEAAVHLAATLTHWLTTGTLRRKP